MGIRLKASMVGEAGLEPAWLAPRDFKSLVYTNSTTRPVRLECCRVPGQGLAHWCLMLEARGGVEPPYKDLQSSA
jgi:hypothetical protein